MTYMLVNQYDVIVACSNSAITKSSKGYMCNGVLYPDLTLSSYTSNYSNCNCVQTKCYCRSKATCVGGTCKWYSQCYTNNVLTAIHDNPNYGEVPKGVGKDLIVSSMKLVNPDLTTENTSHFSDIADSIDTMLDDSTNDVLDIGRDVTAYTGVGKQTGQARLLDSYNSLAEVTDPYEGMVVDIEEI